MSENGSNPPRGQFDPGWNDPPKLQYNSSQSGKTKLNLNKRIAFPLHGSSSSSSTSKPTAIVQPSPSSLPLTAIPAMPFQPPVAIVPPMPQSNPPPTQRVPPLSATESSGPRLDQVEEPAEMEALPENAREFCVNTFQRLVPRIQDSSNIRSDEVQRRINLMKQMWLSGTLTSSVHRKLWNIARALESNNFNEAIENHRALVVDHSNVCTAWAAALRQIILTIQGSTDSLGALTPTAAGVLVPTTAISSDTPRPESQSDPVGNNIQNI